ncbi:acetolactate decarboxylase [Flavimaricola sp.]|nr:acetolactate decarboxylase [Flavimaricola sp.]MDA9020118.1 acetolactate decarboxylase [Flavimaricola sp.]
MAREVIDDRFIGSLHLLALTRKGLSHDPVTERTAIQAGTINALLDGCYEGDTTIGELLRLGSDGIGTVQNLDGELIILSGIAYSARADGSVVVVPPDTKTPFAVVTSFDDPICINANDFAYAGFLDYLNNILSSAPVMAIRASGKFKNLHLRSVAKQYPPYRPLGEVVADQTEWHFDKSDGDIIGFKFPDTIAGVEVPGWHLHFLSKDRMHGGHVISLDIEAAQVEITSCEQLHVELPSDIKLGVIGKADRDAINAVESH